MITYTRGDAAIVPLRVKNRQGEYMSLTGATITAEVLGPYGEVVTIPTGRFTINADQISAGTIGKVSMALTSADTILHGEGRGMELVLIAVQGSSTIRYRARILEVLPQSPRRPR